MTLHLPVINGATCPTSPLHPTRPSRDIHHKRRWGAIVSIAMLLATVFSNPIAHAVDAPGPAERQWTIKNLGSLGGPNSEGMAISESGLVTGFSSQDEGGDLIHAFRYQGGVMNNVGRSDLNQYFGNDINDAGTIVGSYGNRDANLYYPFISNGNSVTPLSDREGAARGINNAGQIVGEIRIAGKKKEFRPFIYKDGKFNILGTFGGSFSSAIAINNSGQLTGISQLAGSETRHAFIYGSAGMVDLGTLGGPYSVGLGINDNGHVVGNSTLSNGTVGHAFVHKGDRMEDLGTLGGMHSRANGINKSGDIVGTSYINDSDTRAFIIYNAGKMVDLNTIPVVKAGGWTLNTANSINDKGQIVGQGVINGFGRAYLLTPVDPRASPYGRR